MTHANRVKQLLSEGYAGRRVDPRRWRHAQYIVIGQLRKLDTAARYSAAIKATFRNINKQPRFPQA